MWSAVESEHPDRFDVGGLGDARCEMAVSIPLRYGLVLLIAVVTPRSFEILLLRVTLRLD